jgi:hypothetical protein
MGNQAQLKLIGKGKTDTGNDCCAHVLVLTLTHTHRARTRIGHAHARAHARVHTGLEYMGCVGIGDGLDVGPFIGLRIIYTSTFFVFINTILINIIFGVIIDTFGDLRERNQVHPKP